MAGLGRRSNRLAAMLLVAWGLSAGVDPSFAQVPAATPAAPVPVPPAPLPPPPPPPPPPRPLARPPFAASESQVNDPLTGQARYTRPEYSLHELARLPDWLSLGIEQRTRYEGMDGRFRFGPSGRDQQVALQTAVFLEARWRSLRVGGEFLDARAVATPSQSIGNNTNTDEADFLQYYLGWSARNLGGHGIGLDVMGGRFTLDLGGRRLVARNVFRNTINSFGGVSIRVRDDDGRWQVTLFGTQPILRLPADPTEIRDGVHKWDEHQRGSAFSGLFIQSGPVFGGIRGEAYVFHLYEEDRPDNPTRDRRLFTPGIRVFRAPARGAIDFEVESTLQIGESRATASANDQTDLDHLAWLIHAQGGYTLVATWSPRIIVLYDYASGDDDPGNLTNERFDTLFGARRWEFGPTGIFGAFARGNIQGPGIRIAASPLPAVSLTAGYRALWLASARDAWVGTGLQDRTGQSGDFPGQLIEAFARWDVSTNFALEAGYALLIKERFALTAPGAPADGDVNYGYVQSLVRF